MKTMKKIAYTLLVVVSLFVSIEALAQFNRQDMPTMSFQSTSAMAGSGSSYSATPALDDAGMAVYGGSDGRTQSGIRRGSTPGTPSTPGEGDPMNKFPIGDGTWILAFLALGYAVWRGVRGRLKTQNK